MEIITITIVIITMLSIALVVFVRISEKKK